MSGIMDSSDFTAEGVVHAMQLAGDALRLNTATPDQLNAAAVLLAKALGRFPEGTSRDPRRVDAIARREVAGKGDRRRAQPTGVCLGPTIRRMLNDFVEFSCSRAGGSSHDGLFSVL